MYGIHASGARSDSVVPKKRGCVTPMIVKVDPLIASARPTASGAAAKCRRQ